MNKFVVTYDLDTTTTNRSSDYDEITEKFSQFYSAAKITESCWIIATYKSNGDVYDIFKKILTKSNDKLFVATINHGSTWSTNCLSTSDKIRSVFNA